MKAQVTLSKMDPKKHSIRYDYEPAPGDTSEPAVRSLYVSKSVLTEPWPRAVTVTIEDASE